MTYPPERSATARFFGAGDVALAATDIASRGSRDPRKREQARTVDFIVISRRLTRSGFSCPTSKQRDTAGQTLAWQ
jgi:hypothetical protein